MYQMKKDEDFNNISILLRMHLLSQRILEYKLINLNFKNYEKKTCYIFYIWELVIYMMDAGSNIFMDL